MNVPLKAVVSATVRIAIIVWLAATMSSDIDHLAEKVGELREKIVEISGITSQFDVLKSRAEDRDGAIREMRQEIRGMREERQ